MREREDGRTTRPHYEAAQIKTIRRLCCREIDGIASFPSKLSERKLVARAHFGSCKRRRVPEPNKSK